MTRCPQGAGAAPAPVALGASEWRRHRRLGSAGLGDPASRSAPRAVSPRGTDATVVGAGGRAGDPPAWRRGRGGVGAYTPGLRAFPSPWGASATAARSPCASRLPPDSRVCPPRLWAQVSLATGVPSGLGCVSPPPHGPSPVDAGATLKGVSVRARHGGPPFRPAVARGREDPPLRRVSRACPGVGWSTAQPLSWPVGRRHSSASAPPPARRFPRGVTRRLSRFSSARRGARSDAA